MPTVRINPLDDRRWDDFVERHNHSSVFHQSSWVKVLYRTYGFIPYYYIVVDMNEKIVSGCPFLLVTNFMQKSRLICLPFTDFCWPLISSEEDYIKIADAISEINYKGFSGFLEIRGTNGFPGMAEYSYYKRFSVDLSPGIDAVWRRMSEKSIRYSIKRAERENIVIEFGESENELKQFYRLNVMTRRRHGVIPQPYKFFKNLYEEYILKKQGFLLLAKKDNVVVGGSIFLIHRDTIYHKYNASDPRYKQLCSNHLILWKAIQWAIKQDYRAMDLGRTAPDNAGLMSFKRHWGADESDLSYYYYPRLSGIGAGGENNIKYRIVKKIFKWTPEIILQKISDGCYRFIA